MHDDVFSPGELCGTYRIVRLLGRGGFADVYQAVDLATQQKVALKCLQLRHLSNARITQRMVAETELLSELDHPNVVQIEDAGINHGVLWLAMEYLSGSTLRERLRGARGPLPALTALHYARQVAEGVGAAHELNVVHRDLKPENIMITSRDEVKVLDLGAAKFFDKGLTSSSGGGALGTPLYMAPEQIKAEPIGPWTDVYALGLILYEMLAGRHPFADASGDLPPAFEVGSLQLHAEPKALSAVIQGFPVHVWQVIEKAVAKNPSARHASMPDFALAIRGATQRLMEEAGAEHIWAGVGSQLGARGEGGVAVRGPWPARVSADVTAAESASGAAVGSSNAANVSSAEVNVASAEVNAPSAEVNVASAEANVASAEANAPSAKANAPSAEANVSSAKVNVPSAKANVPSAEANVPSAEVNVSSAKANVPSAEVNVASDAVDLNREKRGARMGWPIGGVGDIDDPDKEPSSGVRNVLPAIQPPKPPQGGRVVAFPSSASKLRPLTPPEPADVAAPLPALKTERLPEPAVLSAMVTPVAFPIDHAAPVLGGDIVTPVVTVAPAVLDLARTTPAMLDPGSLRPLTLPLVPESGLPSALPSERIPPQTVASEKPMSSGSVPALSASEPERILSWPLTPEEPMLLSSSFEQQPIRLDAQPPPLGDQARSPSPHALRSRTARRSLLAIAVAAAVVLAFQLRSSEPPATAWSALRGRVVDSAALSLAMAHADPSLQPTGSSPAPLESLHAAASPDASDSSRASKRAAATTPAALVARAPVGPARGATPADPLAQTSGRQAVDMPPQQVVHRTPGLAPQAGSPCSDKMLFVPTDYRPCVAASTAPSPGPEKHTDTL